MTNTNPLILLLIAMLLLFTTTTQALAANCPNTSVQRPAGGNPTFEIGACAARHTHHAYQPYELVSKLVDCMQGTIRDAVGDMMDIIKKQFEWLVAMLGTLVIIFHGIRVAMGERELLKRSITLAIKISVVVGFMNMLPTLVDWVYAIFDDLMRLVSGGISPWRRIDAFLGKLFGFGPDIVLLNGLIGLVGAAVFSSTVGITLFFFGIIAILNVITFIIALIYTYCLAMLTIGFLLVLSPVMIPLALFFYTERYFKTWWNIIVSAVLTPVLIFAFVWMFIGIFDVLIQNILQILGGNNFKAYWRINNGLFSWVMPSDPNTGAIMQNLPGSTSLDTETGTQIGCAPTRNIIPPVQGNINPFVHNGFNAGTGRFASLDFGANDVGIVQRLSFAFMNLWIFASLMKSMVGLLPQVASSIAGVSSHIVFGGGSAALEKLQGGVNKLQSGVQNNMAGDASKFKNITSLVNNMSNMVGRRN